VTYAPLKSLLVSKKYFPPQVGGISHMMWEICRALGPREVCALTAQRAGSSGPPANAGSGVRVYRRPLAFSGAAGLQALGLGAAAVEIGLRERPRSIQLATCEEGYLALHLSRLLRLPYIVYAHGNEVLAARDSRWAKPRLALTSAGRVLANSRYTAGLLASIGVDERRVEIIHPGCDVAHYRPIEPRAGAFESLLGRPRCPMILTVGGLVQRKGHDLVIRALPAILPRMPQLLYVIVGEGPNRIHLEELAGSLGVRRNVHFAGRVAHERLPEYFALCDAYVMPSRARLEHSDVEGFGLVYLEANACAKPVIGGRAGGVPDAIVHGKTGFLVDPGDVDDLARAVVTLLGNRELASTMGRQGLERVRASFTWTHVANRVREALAAAAESASGRGLPARSTGS
jgi:phosphatidylinositol alpha-1,6-mannosyltransferase